METYTLTRTIPVDASFDIAVLGGGPGGAAAAICAGRLGAKVVLVEATGCLGGMGTAGLVSAWSDLGDGDRTIAGGIMSEILRRMHEIGGIRQEADLNAICTALHGGSGFQPEALKRLLDQMCIDAGVEIRYMTRLIDVDFDGATVNGVIVNNVEGHSYIKAKAFIDATGDAVLSDLCGVPCFEAGRDSAHIMPPTLCAALAEIDFSRWSRNTDEAVRQGIAEGFFTQNDRHVPGIFRSGKSTAIQNAGHLFEMNALNCRSLSDGYIKGRLLADEYYRFFRQAMPGCEEMVFVATASLMGIRESRRIHGEYELNYADFVARRAFPDQIAVYNKSVDIHVYDTSDEQYARYSAEFLDVDRPKRGETYGLPYGILVPKAWSNLWVAGRCNSSDAKVSAAIRDQPACYMMGQAAGTAAVQSLRTGQPACDLNTQTLIETLRTAGAYLPQESTSAKMTRSDG
ncbi:MAG: FAD-dependent oxidoreductase [Capsulimonadaceae bacterium]|nr:FAD-dependent oxidoreductase [Capsulimonadaceae bacterium]